MPGCSLSISIDGKTKIVNDYVGEWVGMPQVIRDLERDVDNLARTERWIKGPQSPPHVNARNTVYDPPTSAISYREVRPMKTRHIFHHRKTLIVFDRRPRCSLPSLSSPRLPPKKAHYSR